MNTIQQHVSSSDSGSITRICRALKVPPCTYYRWKKKKAHPASHHEEDKSVQKNMESIIEQFPGYGYRRVTQALHRSGIRINHKKTLRIMSENGLLCKRKRRIIRTTDSTHSFKTYPNLLRTLKPTHINQVWVADITYVRLSAGFIYLAVVLDAYSRRCIGWSLGRSLGTDLALRALKQAADTRSFFPGLIHHSDRGVQYASTEYVRFLEDRGIQVSMSRRGNPYDNAKAESFMKTLKYEEVYLMDYANEGDARNRIQYFIEDVYNEKRLHSSLGYVPPSEFESNLPFDRGFHEVVDFDSKIA